MAIPAWFWPPSGAVARGIELVPFGPGDAAVADWSEPTVWPFSVSGSVFLAKLPLASGTPGLAGAVSDGSSGLWAVGWSGQWWHIASGGTVSASGLLSSSSVYLGCASPNGSGLFLANSGSVYTSGGTVLGTWPVSASSLTWSGATLLALNTDNLLTMNGSTGVTGQIAYPAALASGSCFTAESGTVAVAGYSLAATLSGVTAAALDPQNSLVMAAVGTGFALQWAGAATSGESWVQSQVLTGLDSLNACAWRPDGLQLLGTSYVSGTVQALTYTAGLLSLNQTLSVSGAISVAIAGTSTNALVAQSGVAQLAALTYTGGTWASAVAATGFPGITAVAPIGSSLAAAAWASGVSFLSLSSGVWSVYASAALPFAPTALTIDPFLQVYAAGSGSLAVFSGSTYLGSGSWAGGAPTAIAVQQGRIVLAVPTDNSLYVYGKSGPNAWSLQASAALALGSPVGLGLSSTILFVLGSGSTVTYGFSGVQFALSSVLSGEVAQWNGSSWTSTALGVGHTPSACVYDASGNLQVSTIQNTLWSITSGGVGTSGIIQQGPGQSQAVFLGSSSLLSSGGHLFSATSMPGLLTEIS
jgi:hypothetical protein